ncbi:MAG: corrinoid protein [Deltaproteobacteria bacterium]|nr:corrinoid protein [Deltaproteobacteria bacterium]
MSDMNALQEVLIAGDGDNLTELVQSALDEGVSAAEILNQGLIAGMDIVGEKMKNGDMFIPEVLMAARAMGLAVAILKPLLGEEGTAMGKVIIGTVKGDLHDIGKNLVAMMLESAGLEVIDLGVDVAPEIFVENIIQLKPDVVAMSALLTTTMPMMRATVDAISESGLREQIKIIIGGAPVNQSFADEIGADGYSSDAGSASQLAKAYCQN